MPFIPHTQQDIDAMLSAIGADNIEQLFDEIPAELRSQGLKVIPEGINEMEIVKKMKQVAQQDGQLDCFVGAGAYEHYIPTAVWDITTRGEFYSAYTPYQAEASQGTLQVIYEFQTMMCNLLQMEVANASLYDASTALAEAVLMAIRCNRQSKSSLILVPKSVHPTYRKVLKTITQYQKVNLVEIDFCKQTGQIDQEKLQQYNSQDVTAVIIPQPNFFGALEATDELTNWAHAKKALVIGVVNPTAMALIKPPGDWGERGADIVCGEGQPLGVPLSFGGPYFGFMCTRQQYIRQMPGRIVGRTVDLDGKPGFTLTLQAREQHIRRAKATSNICTNQGLMVTAATIYMSLLGPTGLQRVASQSINNLNSLIEKLCQLPGVEKCFSGASFHETVLKLPIAASELIKKMAEHKIIAGFDLSHDYSELGNAILICATETKTEHQLANYIKHFE